MVSPVLLEAFEKACADIANEAALESGFVPVRNLLARFQADLSIRPLLVEGMIASINSDDTFTNSRSSWMVLIDSETSGIDKAHVELEDKNRQLPARVRNTIAHELVHTLAFRPSQFGIKLAINSNEKDQGKFVELIERETERLSPFLLIPEKALHKLLGKKTSAISADDANVVVDALGVSRDVLINRLRALKPVDASGLRISSGLKNVGLGIGEWTDANHAVLRKWPLFLNFDRNIVPTLFLELIHSDNLPVENIHDGLLEAAKYHEAFEFVSDAGVGSAPRAEKMKIQFTIEKTARKPKQRFIFAVSKNND